MSSFSIVMLVLATIWLTLAAAARIFGSKDSGYRIKKRGGVADWIQMYGQRGNINITFCLYGYNDYGLRQLIIHLFFGKLYVTFPKWMLGCSKHAEDNEMQYGFYTYENESLWLWWGKRHKVIYWPWSWKWIGTWYRTSNGWLLKDHWKNGELKDWSYDREWQMSNGILYEQYPYRYVTKSGAIQDVTAWCHVTRREWKWRLWWWLGISPENTKIILEVEFSDDIGESKGSWKGGTIGCAYTMLQGETMEQTLRRMEKERKFR